MTRKYKYSKEEKIAACKKYIEGNMGYRGVAKEYGCNHMMLRQWCLTYKIHGEKAFDPKEKNRQYTKGFKESVIKEYQTGEYGLQDLSAKYDITSTTISKWISKYYNGIDLRNYKTKGEICTMKSHKTTFDERLEIVKWVIENGMNYKEATKKFNNAYHNIYNWTQSYLKNGADGLRHQKRGPKKLEDIDLSKLSEVERLKLELKMERELRKRREFEIEVLKKKEEFQKNILSQK